MCVPGEKARSGQKVMFGKIVKSLQFLVKCYGAFSLGTEELLKVSSGGG